MQTQYEKVKVFREQVELPISSTPNLLSETDLLHHTQHLLKKITELIEANRAKDLNEVAELTVDLVYLTMGMAHNMGLPFNELFDAVHRSNLMKTKASEYARALKGCEWDLNKPVSYVSAQTALDGIGNILASAKASNC